MTQCIAVYKYGREKKMIRLFQNCVCRRDQLLTAIRMICLGLPYILYCVREKVQNDNRYLAFLNRERKTKLCVRRFFHLFLFEEKRRDGGECVVKREKVNQHVTVAP